MNFTWRNPLFLFLAAGLSCALAAPVAAAGAGRGDGPESGPESGPASEWAVTKESRVRLIAAASAAAADGTLGLGVQIRLSEGWKTYWRSPGDAGLPPGIDWTGSRNLASAEIFWPAPRRFSEYGIESIGYEDEVVLPIAARVADPGEALVLRTRVDYLVCREICIPREAELALDLPKGPGKPSGLAHLIGRYLSAVPGDGIAHGLVIERVETAARAGEPGLRIVARSALRFSAPDIFIEGDERLWFGPPEAALTEEGKRAVLTLPVEGAPEGGLVGTPLVLTLVDEGRSMEARLTVREGPPVAESAGPPATLLVILGLALLGGLILNLMPCVLPVLSLKLLGAIGHGGGDRGAVRLSFLESAAGIVFSFLLLAAFAVGLKLAGHSVGWGIQFQQPLFLVAMTLVLVLFACNLWGFFEITLPGWMGNLVARGAGDPPRTAHTLGGNFLTGVFATLLATPCTAPFLGTAVGFALARGTGETFAVFLALGIGFAVPYLAMAAAPGLATNLPRPGPWMATLRRILGFALAATALWLISILSVQVSIEAAALIGVMAALVVAVLWGKEGIPGRWGAPALAGVLMIAALAVPGVFGDGRVSAPTVPDEVWRPFDEAEIAALVESGQVVLVDVTADWCITCKVNKKLVLERGEVAELLGSGKVAARRADWTLPNEDITAYLAGFGRYGVPFNVVYGPAAADGIVLPELLTAGAVLDAIARAAGGEARALAGRDPE